MVSTAGVAAVVEAVGHTVAARGIGCVFGDPGVGKTVAVQQALHLLPARVVVWRAVVGVKPGLPQMRASLLDALGLAAGSLSHRAQPADRALGEALRRPGVLFLDDAQRLRFGQRSRLEHMRPSDDGVERCPQLVRDGCQKSILKLAGALG